MADTTYAPPADIDARRSRALVAGGIGLAACALGFIFDRGHFFRSWLIAYLLFLGIALGSMALLMIQHLSGGAWGIFRRVFEASSRTLPLMALLFLPIVLGMGSIYPWTHADLVQQDEVLRHKAIYLNTGFFLVRALVYFGGWITLAWTLSRLSRRQDEGDMSVNLRIQYVSGGGIVFYAFSATSAAIDWIMSINPHWYSTLFGFIFIGGQGLSALAFTIVVSTLLAQAGADGEPAQAEPLPRPRQAVARLRHALGLLQLLAVHARLCGEPRRGDPVFHRQDQPRLAVPRAVSRDLPFRRAVPAAALARPEADAAPPRLGGAGAARRAVSSICSCWCRPSSTPRGRTCTCCPASTRADFFVHWLDLAAPLAIGGLWLWMFFTQLAQRPLLAFGDPYLREALESTGGH